MKQEKAYEVVVGRTGYFADFSEQFTTV